MRLLRRLRHDGGMTLVELMVSMLLMGIVGSLVTAGVVNVVNGLRHTDNENQGLSDVRNVAERIARDVRDARGVYSGATQSQLQIWIDYNSDYRIENSTELVTWTVPPIAQTGGHYYVYRCVGLTNPASCGPGTGVVEARTLITNIAFAYFNGASQTASTTGGTTTTQVQVDVQYDAFLGTSSTVRHEAFQVRLRNACGGSTCTG